jgi:hypothetical protein
MEPKAMSALRKGFKQTATPILDKAKAEVVSSPLSGWGQWRGRLDWDQGKIQKGLRSQVSVTKRSANMRLLNASPAGAVFETAGSKNPGSQFNRVIMDRYGDAPRLLVKTWKREKGIKTTFVAVKKLIAEAEAEVERVTL